MNIIAAIAGVVVGYIAFFDCCPAVAPIIGALVFAGVQYSLKNKNNN